MDVSLILANQIITMFCIVFAGVLAAKFGLINGEQICSQSF